MKILREKNGLAISVHSSKETKDRNNIKRYGIMIVTQKMDGFGVTFKNGEKYHEQETELSIDFGYYSIMFTRYR
jgi:hypothetical protein